MTSTDPGLNDLMTSLAVEAAIEELIPFIIKTTVYKEELKAGLYVAAGVLCPNKRPEVYLVSPFDGDSETLAAVVVRSWRSKTKPAVGNIRVDDDGWV